MQILLDLLAGVALLVWGTYIVRTDILRLYGGNLRRVLRPEHQHARLVANLRLGMSVFLHGDLKSAQQLLAEEVLFRDLGRSYADSHNARLTSNTQPSIETSSLHLDLISDLKRINSQICPIAYPILEQAGVLAKTRLKEAPALGGEPAAVPNDAATEEAWKNTRTRHSV